MTNEWVIVGRSSSHYTRVVRVVAAEIGTGYSFEPIYDLTRSGMISQTRASAWLQVAVTAKMGDRSLTACTHCKKMLRWTISIEPADG